MVEVVGDEDDYVVLIQENGVEDEGKRDGV